MDNIRYDVLKCPRQTGSCQLLKSFGTRKEASEYIQQIKSDIGDTCVLGIYELTISDE